MEFVLVVPRSCLFPEHYPQGFTPLDEEGLRHLCRVVDESGFFVERERAESEPEWKQIIPYVAVAQGEERLERLFVMRRLKKGGEARLHGKRSVGVGGHLNPEDAIGGEPRSQALLRGALREIAEEVHVQGEPELVPIGLINDDATAVGAVHVGLACVLVTPGPVAVREDEILEGSLLTPADIAELVGQGANFETWSSFLIDALFSRASTSGGAHEAAFGDVLGTSTAWTLDSLQRADATLVPPAAPNAAGDRPEKLAART